MKKVQFTAILAVLVTAISMPLFAQDASDFKFDKGEITRYTGTSKDVVIPGQINGIPVTTIGYGAFQDNQLTSVTIPNSVTSINTNAFWNNQLTSVTIPNSVTSISQMAFSGNQLTSVTIPNSVTSISQMAFSGNQLTSVTLPNNVSIAHDAFYNNKSISELGGYYSSVGKKAGTYSVVGKGWLLPLSEDEAKRTAVEDDFDIEQLANGTLRITSYSGTAKNLVVPTTISGVRVTSIGKEAFKNKGLYSVVIPDGITEILDGAFSNNTLTSISIGKGLKIIPTDAFYRNQHLTTLVIPDGITEIGYRAFRGCALSGITWGKGLVKIDVEAFSSNNFTELTFPNSVTFIGQGAFFDNPLTAIVLPASLAQYDAGYSRDPPRGFRKAFGWNPLMNQIDLKSKNVTRITVPANMAEANLSGLPDNFVNFWKSQNNAAGTYVLKGRIWARE
ncbi:hypothetical protein AGMMS49940_00130 [Spirochaetia bacterium]|nr:hypothetical protein AGMMS49940_00130 [Spirochaetia bacterium]